MKKLILLVVFVLTILIALTSINNIAEAKPITKYNHTVVVDGIAYHHYYVQDDEIGYISRTYTTWIDEGAGINTLEGWKYPPPLPNTGNVIKNTTDNNYYTQTSKQESVVKLDFFEINSNLKINTTPSELFVSSDIRGTAQIFDTKSGILILDKININIGDNQRINLPFEINNSTPYTFIFTSDNGKKQTVTFYFTVDKYELQNKK